MNNFVKLSLFLLLIILSCLIISSCEVLTYEEPTYRFTKTYVDDAVDVIILTDNTTGVQYVVYKGSISVLLDQEGNPLLAE